MLNYQRVFQNSGLGSDCIRTPKKTWSRHHLPCRIRSRASNQLMPMGENDGCVLRWRNMVVAFQQQHIFQDHPGPSRTPVQSSSISRFLFYAFAAWIPTPFFGNAGNATLALVLGKATQQDLRLNPDGNSATTKKTTG